MENEERKWKQDSVWQRGADAFRAGAPRSANPFETHDFNNREKLMDRDAWDNGWRFARECHYRASA